MELVNSFVQLPDELKLQITAVVLWVVSFFLAKLIALVPFLKFLEEFRQPLAMAIAAALIEALQNAVPDAYAAVAVAAVQLVLVLLALFTTGEELKFRGVRALQ